MSAMRNYLRQNEGVTQAVFWICVATVVGSLVWILVHT